MNNENYTVNPINQDIKQEVAGDSPVGYQEVGYQDQSLFEEVKDQDSLDKDLEEKEEVEDSTLFEEQEEGKASNIIHYAGKSFELKYNMKTLELIERSTKTSIMGAMVSYDGTLPLNLLRVLFSRAIYVLDGGRISPEGGEKIFEALLNEKGYVFVNMLVIVKIQEDCPFFFQGV